MASVPVADFGTTRRLDRQGHAAVGGEAVAAERGCGPGGAVDLLCSRVGGHCPGPARGTSWRCQGHAWLPEGASIFCAAEGVAGGSTGRASS